MGASIAGPTTYVSAGFATPALLLLTGIGESKMKVRFFILIAVVAFALVLVVRHQRAQTPATTPPAYAERETTPVAGQRRRAGSGRMAGNANEYHLLAALRELG